MATIPRESLTIELTTIQILVRRSVDKNSLFYILDDSVITLTGDSE